MWRTDENTRSSRGWPFSPSQTARLQEEQEADIVERLHGASSELRTTSVPRQEEIQGVYIISVAARLLSMHPQTLRKYERVGLIIPTRSVGMLRLYSEEDIARLRLIKYLVDDLGLNLAGVELVMTLINRLLRLRLEVSQGRHAEGVRELVAERLDSIFELVNLIFPKDNGR